MAMGDSINISLWMLGATLLLSSHALVSAQTLEQQFNTTFINATYNNDVGAIASALQMGLQTDPKSLNLGLKDADTYLDTARLASPTQLSPRLNFTRLLGQAAIQQPSPFVAAAKYATDSLSNYSIRADASNKASTVDIFASALYAASSSASPAARSLLVAFTGLKCESITLVLNYAYNDNYDAARRIAQFDDAATSPIIQCFRQGGPDANPSYGSGFRYQGTFVEGFYRAKSQAPMPSPTVAAGRRMLLDI